MVCASLSLLFVRSHGARVVGYSGVLQLNADNLMPYSAALPPLARGKNRDMNTSLLCAVPPTAAILELRFCSHPSVVLGSKPVVYGRVVYCYQHATCVVQQNLLLGRLFRTTIELPTQLRRLMSETNW